MTCAHVVNVAMKKIPGVESVEVSLNKGSADVKLKPGNTVRIEQLWETVRNNGFSAKDTGVVVRGEIALANGKARLKVSGLNQSYEIVNGFQQYAGRAVTVQGIMTPPKDKKSAGRAAGDHHHGGLKWNDGLRWAATCRYLRRSERYCAARCHRFWF